MISIVIPVYQTLKELSFCLNSISDYEQELPYGSLEIIVVDDSGDITHNQVVTSVVGSIKFRSHVEVVLANTNRGVTFARNKGFFRSAGNWVVFLDSDDRVINLPVLFEYLEQQPEYVCLCFIRCIDEYGKVVGSPMVERRGNWKQLLKVLGGGERMVAVRRVCSRRPPYISIFRNETAGLLRFLFNAPKKNRIIDSSQIGRIYTNPDCKVGSESWARISTRQGLINLSSSNAWIAGKLWVNGEFFYSIRFIASATKALSRLLLKNIY